MITLQPSLTLQLKSDYFRIEIDPDEYDTGESFELKSDYFRIEI